MYIVYDTDNNLKQLRSKYLVLELDTIEITEGKSVTAYAVVDNSKIPLQDMGRITEYMDLHANLIKNYRLQNWDYCEQAMGHLMGCFKGEIDSFYEELVIRIAALREATIADGWTGNIITISE